MCALPRRLSKNNVPRDQWRQREERAIRIFRRKAHVYLSDKSVLVDDLRCLAMMQHHGAPTRLLDFTKSPFVAAFFALEKAGGPAAVYALNTPWIWAAGPDFDPTLTRDAIDPRVPGRRQSTRELRPGLAPHEQIDEQPRDRHPHQRGPEGLAVVDPRGRVTVWDAALTRAGWLAALIPESYGGSGLGLTEASIIMEEINRAGGVSGRPIEPVLADGRSDAATFANIVNIAITDDLTVVLTLKNPNPDFLFQIGQKHEDEVASIAGHVGAPIESISPAIRQRSTRCARPGSIRLRSTGSPRAGCRRAGRSTTSSRSTMVAPTASTISC